MIHEKMKNIAIFVCVVSGAALIIMNTFILCIIVPVIGHHMLSEEAGAAWSQVVHIFGMLIMAFVISSELLFGIYLVQYLDNIKRRKLEIKQGGGSN